MFKDATSVTHEEVLEFAKSRGITYNGPNPPIPSLKTSWLCPSGHTFQAPYFLLKSNSARSKKSGCRYCFGSAPGYSMQVSGQLAQRLQPNNLEVVGKWHGSKAKNTFRCLTCESEWTEFGLSITNKGNKCPVCFPRRSTGGRTPEESLKIKYGTHPVPHSATSALPHPG